MAHSSILGGERAPQRASGRDNKTLGPSDSSDTGSDIQGEALAETDTDAEGSGEQLAAGDERVKADADIVPTHTELLLDDEEIEDEEGM